MGLWPIFNTSAVGKRPAFEVLSLSAGGRRMAVRRGPGVYFSIVVVFRYISAHGSLIAYVHLVICLCNIDRAHLPTTRLYLYQLSSVAANLPAL